MRFTTIFVAGAFAVAASAQTTTTSAATTTTVQSPESSLQAQIAQCLADCDESDVVCRAGCVPRTPPPNDSDANATNECVADCDQGDGSQAQTDAYAQCVAGCINDHFFATGGPSVPTATGANSSGATPSATPIVSTVTSGSTTFETTITPTPSGTSGSGSSPTESGAGTSSTPNAAGHHVVNAGAALVGVFAAALAL